MPQSKFFVITSKDHGVCAIIFEDAPPTEEMCEMMLGEEASLEYSDDTEQSLQDIFREIDGSAAIDVDRSSILLRIYTFFVAGWNAAAKKYSQSTKSMTVDTLREQITHGPHELTAGVLGNFLQQVKFDFSVDRQVLSHTDFTWLLVGSFQSAFVAFTQRFVREGN